MNGWIDEIHNGVVYGRLMDGREEYAFSQPVLDVLECQRVELEPGRYVSFINGYLLIDKAIWTTHDIENAKQKAIALRNAIWPAPSTLTGDERK